MKDFDVSYKELLHGGKHMLLHCAANLSRTLKPSPSSPCVGLELDFCYKYGGHRHSRTQLCGVPHIQRIITMLN